MAKKKSKKSQKAVGGMKLPKTLKNSGAFAALFNSQLGREILADALIAAAGAAAAALVKNRPSMQQVKDAGGAVAEAGSETASATKDVMQTAAGAVAGVVTEAARNFLPSTLVGDEEERRTDKRYMHLAEAGRAEKKTKSRDKPRKH